MGRKTHARLFKGDHPSSRVRRAVWGPCACSSTRHPRRSIAGLDGLRSRDRDCARKETCSAGFDWHALLLWTSLEAMVARGYVGCIHDLDDKALHEPITCHAQVCNCVSVSASLSVFLRLCLCTSLSLSLCLCARSLSDSRCQIFKLFFLRNKVFMTCMLCG